MEGKNVNEKICVINDQLTHLGVIDQVKEDRGSKEKVDHGSDLSSLGENVIVAVPPVASADSLSNATNALVTTS